MHLKWKYTVGHQTIFYLPPKEQLTTEPCLQSACTKMSGTTNNNQLNCIEAQLAITLSGGPQLPL